MLKFEKQNTIVTVLLALLFGGSSLINLGNADYPLDPSILRLRYILFSVSLIILLVMSPLKIWSLPNRPLPLIFSWMSFSFFIFLSGSANDNFLAIRDGIWFLFGIPIFFFRTVPSLMNKHSNLLISLGLFIGVFPYIIASLVLNPVWQFQEKVYRGVFANSNQLGFMAAVMSASIFIFLISLISKKSSFINIFIVYLLLLFSLVLILLANARTSLLGFLAMHFILLIKVLQKPNYVIFLSIAVMALILLALLVIPAEQTTLLLNQIGQIQEKNSLSGRDYIWSQTITDMQLLGHGSDYFEVNFGIGGHNTLIEILGTTGIIPTCFITCFAIASFFYAYSYFQKHEKEDTYASTPLVITTCFWVLSMGEGLFGSLGSAITIAYMLSVGVLISNNSTSN